MMNKSVQVSFSSEQWKIELISYKVLRVNGPDAQNFLQGQLATNLLKLESNSNSYSCTCVHTGRVIATFIINKINEQEFLLISDNQNIDRVIQHLKKYAVFSKVNFTLLNDIVIAFNLDDINKSNIQLDCYQSISLDSNNYLLRSENLYYLLTNNKNVTDILGINLTNIITIDYSEFLVYLMYKGYPIINDKFSDKFIAQALNLHLIEQAVSFNKGCYQGQEAIARAKYRGTNKLTIKLFSLVSEQLVSSENLLDKQIAISLGENRLRSTGNIINQINFNGRVFLQVVLPINEDNNDYYLNETSNVLLDQHLHCLIN